VRELRALRQRRDAEIRKLIASSSKAGARSEDIAEALGISRSTLWRRYGDVLQRRASRPA
jgi:DNA invertase Pin-like site-specific DNA recombinase